MIVVIIVGEVGGGRVGGVRVEVIVAVAIVVAAVLTVVVTVAKFVIFVAVLFVTSSSGSRCSKKNCCQRLEVTMVVIDVRFGGVVATVIEVL